MFLSFSNYKSEIQQLIQSTDSLSVAVAFWGAGSHELFEHYGGDSIRIICNLLSGGTNPYAIVRLMQNNKIILKHSTALHAKVLVGSSVAIIGSANLSTDGLNHEPDEGIGWSEAGLRVATTTDLHDLREWFEREWISAAPVRNSDIALAKQRWALRRNIRVSNSPRKLLSEVSAAEVKDRRIYLVMYKLHASKSSERRFSSRLESSAANGKLSVELKDKLDFFEDWTNLPADAELISVHLSECGEFEIEGVYRRSVDLDELVNTERTVTKLQVIVPCKLSNELRFPASDYKRFASRIAVVVEKYRNSKTQLGKHLTLYSAFVQSASSALEE